MHYILKCSRTILKSSQTQFSKKLDMINIDNSNETGLGMLGFWLFKNSEVKYGCQISSTPWTCTFIILWWLISVYCMGVGWSKFFNISNKNAGKTQTCTLDSLMTATPCKLRIQELFLFFLKQHKFEKDSTLSGGIQ